MRARKEIDMILPVESRKSIGMVVANEDLLLEIFLRMPVKSLIRLKSVSKHWLSLLADPKFCSKHTLKYPTSLVLGTYFYYKRDLWPKQVKSFSFQRAKQRLPTLSFLEKAVPNSTPVILDACKGLFLCSLGERIENYAVCNLATREFTLLPKHGPGLSLESRNSACLVFEPSKSLHYKVVLVSCTYKAQLKSDLYSIDIYSSERRSWECKNFQAQPTSDTDDFKYKAVFNGAIHWMTNHRSHVRFELDAEKLIRRPMSKPEGVDEEDICYFRECGGLLFFAYDTSSKFEVLAMDKNYLGWTLLYHVNINRIKENYPQSFSTPNAMIFMVCVVKEEEDDQNRDNFALLFAICGKIISYNLKSKRSKVICASRDFQPCPDKIRNAYASSFMATLCPV